MRTKLKIYALVVILTTTLSCDKKEDNGEKLHQEISKLVGKEWVLQSVIEQGIDRTLNYSGMTITFEQQAGSSRVAYIAGKGEPVWSAQGTLDCQYVGRLEMHRNDNLQCIVSEVTATELEIEVLNFPYSIGPGRGKSSGGKHVFKFSN
jgi:hypothetical protein